MAISIDTVWARIKKHEGQSFRQIRGKKYTYMVFGSVLKPEGINRNIPRSAFEKALKLLPLEGTSPVLNLQGPSYICSILMDTRIRRGDEWGSR